MGKIISINDRKFFYTSQKTARMLSFLEEAGLIQNKQIFLERLVETVSGYIFDATWTSDYTGFEESLDNPGDMTEKDDSVFWNTFDAAMQYCDDKA